jgi:hypothetical protein
MSKITEVNLRSGGSIENKLGVEIHAIFIF